MKIITKIFGSSENNHYLCKQIRQTKPFRTAADWINTGTDKMDKQQVKAIASEMMNQLGGSRFRYMVGVKMTVYDCKGDNVILSMNIGRNKTSANFFKMIYDSALDLYVMQLIRKTTSRKTYETTEKIVAETKGVYCDMVQATFTEMTGLYTHL